MRRWRSLPGVADRHPWWTSFVLFFALGSLWSLASPLFSVPDEPSHVVWAAAVARGQLRAQERTTTVAPNEDGEAAFVRVPEVFVLAHEVPGCYAFHPREPADCAPAFAGPHRTASVRTNAGRYPPVYYLVTGLPSVPLPTAIGVRAMRLVSAAVSAAFLASAVTALRRMDRRAPLLVGLAVAVTPMTLYLAGSVNPSSVEAAAAIALWASLVALAQGAPPTRPVVVTAAAGAGGLALSRPLSPLWVGVIGLCALIIVPWDRIRALARDRLVRRGAAAVAVCLVLAGAWILWAQALDGFTAVRRPPADATGTDIVRTSIGRTGSDLRQMVGIFGWLDAPGPALTYTLWTVAVGVLVVSALAAASGRGIAALAVVVVLTVAVPVVIESAEARRLGFVWQGRYTLPLAVGVPLLAAALGRDVLARLGSRLVAVLLGLLVTGHFLAFVWALRRHAMGVDGWFGDPLEWQPPGSALVVVVAFAAALVAQGWWLARLAGAEAPVDRPVPAEPASPGGC
ncbi:MAG TPA: DUF2142 domain-containing protein [Acidimicrobiales bacterium]|nr:DUF2142 domain-containing protein [Acidimicrobiales bacterium]